MEARIHFEHYRVEVDEPDFIEYTFEEYQTRKVATIAYEYYTQCVGANPERVKVYGVHCNVCVDVTESIIASIK